MVASSDFKSELADVVDVLRSCERRIRGLHDLAAHEQLQPEVVGRLGRKANTVELTRSHLEEIPEMLQ